MTDTVRVPMSRQEVRLAVQSGVVAWLSGYKQEYRSPHDTMCDLITDAMLAASPQGEESPSEVDAACAISEPRPRPQDAVTYRVTEGVKP